MCEELKTLKREAVHVFREVKKFGGPETCHFTKMLN
jgi:hypothetical protein